VESSLQELEGLGLLEMETEMFSEKTTTQSEALLLNDLLSTADENSAGAVNSPSFSGYEIHMGQSRWKGDGSKPLFRIVSRNGQPVDVYDGLINADGRVWGTYLHGVFDNDAFRSLFLRSIGNRSGKAVVSSRKNLSYGGWKEEQYDLLAEHVRSHVNMDLVYRVMQLS
jgi:adenosylcobyric acid synthase